jgi:hypothetical protein
MPLWESESAVGWSDGVTVVFRIMGGEPAGRPALLVPGWRCRFEGEGRFSSTSEKCWLRADLTLAARHSRVSSRRSNLAATDEREGTDELDSDGS